MRQRDSFRWVPPRAGSVTFPTLLGGEAVEAFCERVLERAGVLLLPGTVFDPASREIRVGFGRADMPQALERLDPALAWPRAAGLPGGIILPACTGGTRS